MTITRLIGLLLLLGLYTGSSPALAEEDNPIALAQAMQSAKATLEVGLKIGERDGRPISAEFEIENGKLQISI
jgi:hypothetical protein